MKTFLVFLSIIIFDVNIYSQGLKISNGTKVKTFSANSVFEAVISEKGYINKNNCCDYQNLTGIINFISKDSINLKLNEITALKKIDNVTTNYRLLFKEYSNESTIAIDDIYYFQNYKSLKNKKSNRILKAIGGIMLFTGTVTALNNFLVQEKTNKNRLLISGGVQFGVGIALIKIASSKKYYLNHSSETWHFVE